jgi:hypothetical protein
MNIVIGTVVKATRDISGIRAKMGDLGICYELYDGGEYQGASFIFERGGYDGFNPKDIEVALEHIGEIPFSYEFTSVVDLMRDFREGVFPFSEAKKLLIKATRHELILREEATVALAKTEAAKNSPTIQTALQQLRREDRFSVLQILLNCINNLYYLNRENEKRLMKVAENAAPTPIILNMPDSMIPPGCKKK